MAASKSVHQCDICLEDSQIATGYCEDCDEHLCDDCFNYHKKPKFRHHIVFRIHETGTQIRRREYDITREKCNVHDNYFVEFYCEDHNQVGCANCHLKDHKQCENMTDLREINRGVLCSSQVNDCRTALLELNQDAEAIESEVRQNDKKWQECNTECQDKMEHFRHEINEKVDKLQAQLTREVKKASVQNSQILNSTSSSCDAVRVQIKQRISEIERYIKNGHACRMYVALKGLNEDIFSIRNELRKTSANNHVELYTFNPDRQLQSSIFEDVERFGTMEQVVDGSDEVSGVDTMVHNILTKKEMIDDLQQQLREMTKLADKYAQQLKEKTMLTDKSEQQLREKTKLADKYEQQVKDVTMDLDKRMKDKSKIIDDIQHELREKTRLAEKYHQQLKDVTLQMEEHIKNNENKRCDVCKQTTPTGYTKDLSCGHVFHTGCAVKLIKAKQPCPKCGIVTGDQPSGTMEVSQRGSYIEINYTIADGTQGPEHPNPGQHYSGMTKWFIVDMEQTDLCRMLKLAFQRRLVFTIGRAGARRGKDQVEWNIQHTSQERG